MAFFFHMAGLFTVPMIIFKKNTTYYQMSKDNILPKRYISSHHHSMTIRLIREQSLCLRKGEQGEENQSNLG